MNNTFKDDHRISTSLFYRAQRQQDYNPNSDQELRVGSPRVNRIDKVSSQRQLYLWTEVPVPGTLSPKVLD